MLNTVLGLKKGMTSTYDSRGRRVGATVVLVEPNYVTQIKTKDGTDKYNAVQIASMTKKSVKKPQIGHAKKAGVEKSFRFFREAKIDDTSSVTLGQEIKSGDIFRIGDAVKVTGISKGKGFQGGVRRHGFHGGPKTHGQSDRHRAPGSIGAGTTPGRVYKGKKMAGHMGVEQVSYKNLEVVGIDKENNLLTLKGGIPGPIGGMIIVEKLGRMRGYTPPPEEKEEEEGESSDSVDQNVSESVEPIKSEENAEVVANTDNTDNTDSTETTETEGEKENA